MKNKKGNVAVFGIIIVIIAITAGFAGWILAKKLQAPLEQKPNKVESEVKELVPEAKEQARTINSDRDEMATERILESSDRILLFHNKNEKEAYDEAISTIAYDFVKEKIENVNSFIELKNKTGNEFFGKDFINIFTYRKQNPEDSELYRLNEKIIDGPIEVLNIKGYKIYSAPNYFNWSFDKFKKELQNEADMGSPEAVKADKDNLIWIAAEPCAGGAFDVKAAEKSTLVGISQCKIILDGVIDYQSKQQ